MEQNLETREILSLVRSGKMQPQEAARLLRQNKSQGGAFNTIDQLRQNASGTPLPKRKPMDIAIVGMSGRYPGASNTRELWQSLQKGTSAITEVPRDRWDAEAFFAKDASQGYKSVSKWGGFLKDIDKFDSLFFNISPREAELMDPQQRVFLEEAYKALEDAGYHEDNLSGRKCGIFVGCKSGDYQTILDIEHEEQSAFIFMGNNESILAARIAYHLNLRGPAVAIDTACSSSLLTIYLACESILSGSCEMALAGGVSLLTTPVFHVLASKAGMLTSSDQCRAFDQGAAGFVPAEGVGAVVLKPLEVARSDRDKIYGVIKAGGINQDGRSNGITAPNAASQTALECEVYDRFAINPESISYIETHGTGTKLGDPIEINALKDAFAKYTKKRNFCDIGSIKTNIGHSTAAAGVAGVIKVLLCMQHGKLVPSANFERPNEHIKFEDSPFRVNTECKDWAPYHQGKRLAAVSAFGFSGTNAHLLLEEPPERRTALPKPEEGLSWLIPLSARKESVLLERIKDLYRHLNEVGDSVSLADVAYTLLVRRGHHACRCFFVADSLDFLKKQLQRIVADADLSSIEVVRAGRSAQPEAMIKEAQTTIAELGRGVLLAGDERRRKLESLGRDYIKGTGLSWETLFANTEAQCISLPTYPFVRESHWVAKSKAELTGNTVSSSVCHPLLHSNISTFEQQKFRTIFSGNEFFLTDHLIQGQKVLPGAAYLEMARAAGALSMVCSGIRIRNVVWAHPVIANGPVELMLGLYPDKDTVMFDIATTDSEGILQSHCRGTLEFLKSIEPSTTLDLATIRKRLSVELDARTCYQRFQKMGLAYGKAFRTIKRIWGGEGEALSEFSLPAALQKEAGSYGLHPSILDGALQSLIGIQGEGRGDSDKTYVPYSMGAVHVYSALPESGFVHVKAAENPSEESQYFTIQIADATGSVCVLVERYGLREMVSSVVSFGKEQVKQNAEMELTHFASSGVSEDKLILGTQWRSLPLEESTGSQKLNEVLLFCKREDERDQILRVWQEAGHASSRAILVTPGKNYTYWAGFRYEIDPTNPDHYALLFSALKSQGRMPGCILHLWDTREATLPKFSDRLHGGPQSLFLLAKALNDSGVKPMPIFRLYPVNGKSKLSVEEACAGMARCLAVENPPIDMRLIGFEEEGWENTSVIAQAVVKEVTQTATQLRTIRYVENDRLALSLEEKALSIQTQPECKVEKGVYWITGGMGGIGWIFAQYLAQQTHSSLVLTGRSPLDAEQETRLERLRQHGAKVLYFQADVSNLDDTERVFRSIKKEFGQLTGVIHSAGLTCDAPLSEKSLEQFHDVLAPKVWGCQWLDQVTQDEPLGFFVVFSALGGLLGNPGQCDYAYANRFLDAWIEERKELVAQEKRKGISLSIGWPLWANGGMHMNEATADLLRSTMGIEALRDEEGLQVFETLLNRESGACALIKGDPVKVRKAMGLPAKTQGAQPKKSVSAVSEPANTDWHAQLKQDTKQLVSEILKVNPEDIHLATEMSEFGFDSIGLTEFSNKLNEKYRTEVLPSVFFEHPTLEQFLGYLISNEANRLADYYRHGVASENIGTAAELAEIQASDDSWKDSFQTELVELVSDILKVNEADVAFTAQLSEFGFDSIGLTQFANKLNERYKLEIMPSVFFEYPTLQQFHAFLCQEFSDQFLEYFVEQPVQSNDQKHFSEQTKTVSSGKQETQALKGLPPLPKLGKQKFISASFESVPRASADAREPLAIVGISGKMPGCSDLEQFWQHLEREEDLITEIPPQRWDWRGFYGDPSEGHKTKVKWGGFVQGVDQFDTYFFGISPREAELMDPQQRLFMQTVWEVIEDAGYKPSDLYGSRTSLFAGITTGDYVELLSNSKVEIQPQSATGISHCMLVNRISHMLNLRGPSEPVDTACSSSLVAIHRAAESIWSGQCEMAIAGGVNLILTPTIHIGFTKAGMLSPDGRSKTFDQSANGYARGEGVGAVLLKSLSKAEAQGDSIYGLICGSAINHGGRANSLTAPNPNSQAEVIVAAHKMADFAPDTISYFETHGTGTSLGDPIEINGIRKAFKTLCEDYQQKYDALPVCKLGSVKTNVGHLEAAAGMAGMFKVLLSFKYKKLPGTVHLKTVNPYIELDKSNLDIVRRTEAWKQPRAGDEKPLPRRAGLSSFGFGGVNAHVALEEYMGQVASDSTDSLDEHIFVLSAKNSDRLCVYATNLADFLEKTEPLSLRDLAYTLQVGREAMAERLAIVAHDRGELVDRLRWFAAGKTDRCGKVHTGCLQESCDSLASLIEGDEGNTFVQMIFQNRKFDKLAVLWASGLEIDWLSFYKGALPRRLHLPTYPFERSRFWVPQDIESRPNSHPCAGEILPALSMGAGIVTEKVFTCGEAVLADHRVRGACIMPAAAYLEIAVGSAFATHGFRRGIVSKVYWLKPFEVGENPRSLRIRLVQEGGALNFSILTVDGDQELEHSRGTLVDSSIVSTSQATLDLDAIRKRCSNQISGDELYSGFSEQGIVYGPMFQRLACVFYNEEEALGEIRSRENETYGSYILHPGTVDAAFQTLAGLSYTGGAPDVLYLPFGAEEVEIFSATPDTAFAYVQKAGYLRYNVAILDEAGRVCVAIKDLSIREMRNPVHEMLYKPDWKVVSELKAFGQSDNRREKILLISDSKSDPTVDSLIQQLRGVRVIHARLGTETKGYAENEWTLDCSDPGAFDSMLDGVGQIDCLFYIAINEQETRQLDAVSQFEDASQSGVLALFNLTKSLIAHGYKERKLLFKVITSGTRKVFSDELIRPGYSALSGFILAMAKEFPHWSVINMDLDGDLKVVSQYKGAWALLMSGVGHLDQFNGDSEIVLRRGLIYQRTMKPLRLPPSTNPFRENGVYFIVGGAGGLGLETAKFLASTVHAKIVLVGRSELQGEKQKQVETLEQFGSQVLYLQADAGDSASLEAAVEQAEKAMGPINGVIHSALVLEDCTIENMDEAMLRNALAPKVYGSVNLYRAFRGKLLDFMLFFSSAQSFSCNAGQSNYAAGCTFQDSYALALAEQAGYPVGIINWGYWGTVGIVASEKYNKELERQGIKSISPGEGMEALSRIAMQPVAQVMALKADEAMLEQKGFEVKRPWSLVQSSIPQMSGSFFVRSELQVDEGDVIKQFKSGLQRINEYGRNRLLDAFQRMGVFRNAGEAYQSESLQVRLNIIPQYHRLFQALLGVLRNANYLELRQGTLTYRGCNESVSGNALSEQRNRLIEDYPEFRAFVDLLDCCLEGYPQILIGKRSHMEVMFPGGSMEKVEQVYKDNPLQDAYNRAVAQCARNYVLERMAHNPNEKITLVEIGSGTGGASKFVFEALSDLQSDLCYIYTDVSVGFVNFGKKEYGGRYAFGDFRILDIEKDPLKQGFEGNDADVILASNVLHATRNIGNVLRQAKKLLKPNGLMVINELTQPQEFSDLTFGLTEGWWLFEDENCRLPNSPLLDLSRWKGLLETSGFHNIRVPGNPKIGLDARIQSIIIAEGDACVPVSVSEEPELVVEPVLEKPKVADEKKPEFVSSENQSVTPKPKEKAPQTTGQSLNIVARSYLLQMFSRVLKMPESSIVPTKTFETYGVDSLVVLQINKELERDFGQLPSTLLYEYMTLDKLANYLIVYHPDKLKAPIPQEANADFLSPGNEDVPEQQGLFAKRVSAIIDDKTEEVPDEQLPVPPVSSETSISVSESVMDTEIAIVGVAGRYPESPDVDAFWDNLEAGRNCIREVPKERWDADALFDPNAGQEGKIYSKWGGFLEGIDCFDAVFFGISPREAQWIDPQERLFLESVYELFDGSGFVQSRREKLENQVGVFVGVMNGEYARTGPSYWSIANRVSYFFDLNGPSFAVDCACSSSLAAIHLACESIRRGECRAAVAGGVNLIIRPGHFIDLCSVNMISKGDRCKAFGEGADGFVDGEGVGSVLLKPLDQAQADGDRIYGVIKGSFMNTGGKTSGYTVPNPNAQASLIKKALERANVAPETIGYIEAHGTGTSLGDPIEITALNRAFKGVPEHFRCPVGSVKSNIGHLESAAGIAGLTKVLLQFKHQKRVPSIHTETLNPQIDFSASPFFVQREHQDWPQADQGARRRAGISSFGAGGANVYVIVEDYPETSGVAEYSEGETYIAVFSAKSIKRLLNYAKLMVDFLDSVSKRNESAAEINPENIAYTLYHRREVHEERLAILFTNNEELRSRLHAFSQGQKAIIGVFTDQPETTQPDVTMIDRALVTNDLNLVAQAWVSGMDLEGEKLRGWNVGELIRMPSCPFEKKRIWNPEALSNTAAGFEQPAAAEPKSPVVSETTLTFTQLQTNPVSSSELSDWLDEFLAGIFMDELGVDSDDLSAERNFADLGVDSIHASKIGKRLNESLQLDNPPTVFFNYPSLALLSDYLLENHKDTLQTVYSEFAQKPASGADMSLPQGLTGESKAFSPNAEDIAVVGMAGRFPGADDIDTYWDNLCKGIFSVTEVPKERWDANSLYDPQPNKPGKCISKWAGLLKDVDKFDALFFDILQMEAKFIDPQQRLFLEECWKALEDAGIPAHELSGKRCGVFAGCGSGDYTKLIDQAGSMNAFAMMGNHAAMLPARVAYFLNLRGPVVSVDTACSSSLVAVHQACQSLLTHECEMAIAGGVHLTLTPLSHVLSSSGGMLSAEGKCKTFDNDADGIVIAEGVGAVILKRLDCALRDGDRIHCVIKGSGVNHDGKTNGITAPSAPVQAELIRNVHQRFGIDPESLAYVETHGTGTKLGDPVEIEGMIGAFKGRTNKKHFCALSSVKPNIGHAYQAAGVASFIKAVLCLKHGKLPPMLHFKEANKHFRLEDTPFYVNTELQDLKSGNRETLRAAVNSFGYGGTNAHLVLEAFEARDQGLSEFESSESPQVIVLSAKREKVLKVMAMNLVEYLEEHATSFTSGSSFADLAWTLQGGRSIFSHRLALVACDVSELLEKLNSWLGGTSTSVYTGRVHRVKTQDVALEQSVENKKDPEILAKSWVKGLSINWADLHTRPRRKCALPCYPLERICCWVDMEEDAVEPQESVAVVPSKPGVEPRKDALKVESESLFTSGSRLIPLDRTKLVKGPQSGLARSQMADIQRIQIGIQNMLDV
jgi:polyketide synthase PksM